jgi:alkanesulfonate monooxygenase SsuD/methylene tetrahydromethanopterin reductase-like flavin-dependent oxidoreductase (luciferase family)
MQFGLLYEHQLPRPWTEESEYRLFQEALEQAVLADRLGIDYLWEVEHHFLEEYAHSSAPEVFLAACAARTGRIRLGHGVVLMPPAYNHPARVAERIATLDLISNGRVDFGTGESASRTELEGFCIDHEQKKAMWAECVEQTANMMTMTPYPGFTGEYFSMPCRNVVPKPLQKPHPPIWVACSKRDTIHAAARAGIGALTFAFIDPAEAAKWAGEYYAIVKSDQCVPIGHAVNANIAMVTGFSCHEDAEEAKRRGEDGFRFFAYSLGHFYVYGHHTPGRTDIWQRFQEARGELAPVGAGRGIGTPAQITAHLDNFAQAGVDQVIFIQQGGNNRHRHICQSLELFAEKVMPRFHAQEAERQARKQAELAPYIEAALARKIRLAPLPEDKLPVIPPLGRNIIETQVPTDGTTTQHIAADIPVPLEDPLAKRQRAQAGED